MARENLEEYKEHTGATITKDELTPYLNGQFVALVQLTRAIFPRREVVRMFPFWELFPQLARDGDAYLEKMREEQLLEVKPNAVHALPKLATSARVAS